MSVSRSDLQSMNAQELAALYTYSVVWSWQEQCYVATVDGWSELMVEGPTVKDALKQAQWVVQVSIESFRQVGLAFPVPAVPSSAGRAARRAQPAPANA